MTDPPGSTPEDEAFYASQVERDRTLLAVRSLETSLGKAADADGWLPEVAERLGALEAALRDEAREVDRPDSLLSLIAGGNPRHFGSHVRRLREEFADLIRQVESLRDRLGADGRIDAGDLRHRVGWLINALHHYRARQTDLVYEALERDLGG